MYVRATLDRFSGLCLCVPVTLTEEAMNLRRPEKDTGGAVRGRGTGGDDGNTVLTSETSQKLRITKRHVAVGANTRKAKHKFYDLIFTLHL